MEIRKCEALIAKGKATLERKAAGEFEVLFPRFKPDDGTPDKPEAVPMSKAALEHALTQHDVAIAEHQAEKAGIVKMIAAMDKLGG